MEDLLWPFGSQGKSRCSFSGYLEGGKGCLIEVTLLNFIKWKDDYRTMINYLKEGKDVQRGEEERERKREGEKEREA